MFGKYLANDLHDQGDAAGRETGAIGMQQWRQPREPEGFQRTGYQLSQQRGWSRRGFLSARGLGASAGGFLETFVPDPPLPKPAPGDTRVNYWCIARRAMGCEFTVFLLPQTPDALATAEASLAVIDEMDDLLTVHRPGPTVELNKNAQNGWVEVDARLFELIQRCQQLTSVSDSAFDAATGALVREWGFVHGPPRKPETHEIESALSSAGIANVELDQRKRAVRFRKPGLELNFGSIGKGFALDQAMSLLQREYKVTSAMVQGGLSSFRAIGSPAWDESGWRVGIQNPWTNEGSLATIRLRNRALGTSGDAQQFFEADGRRYGHVLDPRSGTPADGLSSASVIARDATTADALATALFVMGLDKAADFCQNHRDIAALLVLKPDPAAEHATELPRVVTFNLPPHDIEWNPGSCIPLEKDEN